MLLSFRTDRPFEEAARSEEAWEKLLIRLQGNRRLVFVLTLVLCLIALPFVIWAFIRLNDIVTSLGSGNPVSNSDSEVKTLALQMAAFGVPFLVTIGSLTADFRHTDSCVKMLILIRGQKERSVKEGSGNRTQ